MQPQSRLETPVLGKANRKFTHQPLTYRHVVKDKIQGSALVSGLFFSTLIETLFLNQMWFYKNNNYKVIKKNKIKKIQ